MDRIRVFRMDLEWNKNKEYCFSGITGMKDANKLVLKYAKRYLPSVRF